jgi:peroxiredoxin (alkyl hydroperoxide reductase subunit C)
VEHPAAGVAFRGAFIIDKEGVVRSQIVNDLPIGRDMDELIRLIDAVQFFEEHGEVCPAGWKPGDRGMKATPEGVAKYLSEHSEKL